MMSYTIQLHLGLNESRMKPITQSKLVGALVNCCIGLQPANPQRFQAENRSYQLTPENFPFNYAPVQKQRALC